jgi:L-2-hydroxyglutarate oxidase LhgO
MVQPTTWKKGIGRRLKSREADVVIVGAGVVGLCIARALALELRDKRIVLLEKEAGPGRHASGRNSGVIHSGFHLRPGTLRARLCVEGARRLKAYCRQRSIPLLEGGSLVVASSDRDVVVLEELAKRAEANGVRVKPVYREAITRLEPYARADMGLYAPEDAVLDARRYVEVLLDEVRGKGVLCAFGREVISVSEDGGAMVATRSWRVRARLLINAAGAHALRLARLAGVVTPYRVMPFRGEYYVIPSHYGYLVRSALYPAPDLSYPFLGIHFTKQVSGEVLVGPNAVPSMGLEAYSWGLIRPQEALRLLLTKETALLSSRPRNVAFFARELLSSLSKSVFLARARRLIPSLEPYMLAKGGSGIRPQLLDERGQLVDELVLGWGACSLHVLNAISPALTSSLAFGEYIAGLLRERGYIGP